jgi:hypothetical protein
MLIQPFSFSPKSNEQKKIVDCYNAINNMGDNYYKEISISSADIVGTSAGQFGHANGYPLVSAPGAGQMLELTECVVSYIYATAAYTGGGTTTLNWAGGTAITGTLAAANFCGAAANKCNMIPPLATGAIAMPIVPTGINLVVSSAFTQPGTAAGTVRVKIGYRIHNNIGF